MSDRGTVSWEYWIREIDMLNLQDDLDRWGEDGWELVCIYRDRAFIKKPFT